MSEFKIGDKVEWGGAPGVVKQVYKNMLDDLRRPMILVEFEERLLNPTLGGPQFQTAQFTSDGRYHRWHTKPTLFKRLI